MLPISLLMLKLLYQMEPDLSFGAIPFVWSIFFFISFYLVLSFPEKFHHIPTLSILLCPAALAAGYYLQFFCFFLSFWAEKIPYERSAGCFECTYFLPSIHKPLFSIPSFWQYHRHPNEPGSTAEQICHSVLRNDATLLISSRSSQQQRREKATAVNNTSDKVLM